MGKDFGPWGVWYANFPFEEKDGRYSGRPVIVVSVKKGKALVIKLTAHDKRKADKYDKPLQYWEKVNLNRPSVARVSKAMEIPVHNLIARIGQLANVDAFAVFDTFREFVVENS